MSIEDCPHYRGWQGTWLCRKDHCEPGLGCLIELPEIEKRYQENKAKDQRSA